jgi:hypothetical protein
MPSVVGSSPGSTLLRAKKLAGRPPCGVATRIVRLTGVVWVRVPEVPVMVTVEVPGGEATSTVKSRTLVEVVLVGLNEAVTPVASPEALRLTLAEKPLTGFTVMVALRLEPCWMLNALGREESVKPGADPPVIVRLTVVFVLRLPETPFTVIFAVPVAALLATLSVSVDEVVVVVGLKDAVTPVGSPEAPRLTLPEKPLMGFTVMVALPLEPC